MNNKIVRTGKKRRAGAIPALILVITLVFCGCAESFRYEQNSPTPQPQQSVKERGNTFPTNSPAASPAATPTDITAAVQDGRGMHSEEEQEEVDDGQNGTVTDGIETPGEDGREEEENGLPINLNAIPEFDNSPFVILNENIPVFSSDLKSAPTSFEKYGKLDALGRCSVTLACIGKDIMPTEEREGIGQVKPTGWHTVKYDFVDGKYLYNRCHLIGFQLTGENANEQNLITGTRYMNVDGMLPFENMVADYVKETGNHVLYRVTPIYENDNLIAAGVQMEAYSVEDSGEGICFNVFCYNAQPGVVIDYRTGESRATEDAVPVKKEDSPVPAREYILNTNSKKFHYPDCRSVKAMSDKNKKSTTAARDELIKGGYTPCGNCKP